MSSPTSPSPADRDSATLLPQPRADGDAATLMREPGRTGPEWPQLPGYVIVAELGRGGMGVVYKARQLALNRTVALKMVLAGGHAGPADLTRFRAEAEAVARLQHPNIVQIYEVGEQAGQPYFSLEFVDGGTLAQHIAGKLLPVCEAAGLVETLAHAVQYAHQQGILHRDLKPANILLAADPRRTTQIGTGREAISSLVPKDPSASSISVALRLSAAKITDFGLAKRLDVEQGQTQSGSILGTPSYMAPEQAGGRTKEIGPLADVYALGAILYELLTGRPPFHAATPLDTLLQVVSEEPVPPSRLQPKLPRDLETICLKCLEKEPAKRYANAETLAEDLRRFLDGEPILARPVGPVGRLLKWAKRRPAIAALSALVMAVAALGFAGVVWEWRQTEGQRRRTLVALREAEANLYFNHIALADREWSDNNVARTEQLLADCPPGLRDWEWYYLNRRSQAERWTRVRRPAALFGVAYSPDGTRLATGGGDHLVHVWDATTGQQLLELKGHTAAVGGVRFSPDGTRLASASDDKTVRIWDVAVGTCLLTLSGHTKAANRAVFSPDGTHLVTAGNDQAAILWDARSGQRLQTLADHRAAVQDVAFGPGQLLATGSGDLFSGAPGEVKTWDAVTGRLRRTFTGHIGPVYAVALSPDGRRLAAASNFIDIKVWDATTGQEVMGLFGHGNLVTHLTYSLDGRYLASGGRDKSIKVWDAASGREMLAFRGHHGVIPGLAFSPDGRHLASTSEDRTLKVWDILSGQEARVLRLHARSVGWALFSPDGRQVASTDHEGGIKVWDAVTTRETVRLRGHKQCVLGVAFSPDGRWLATTTGDPFRPQQEGDATLWDLATGEEARRLRGHQGGVSGVAFSPDGQVVFTGGYDNTVRGWEVATGQPRSSLRASGPITGVAVSSDGRRLAASQLFGAVTVWDLGTGQPILSEKTPSGPNWTVAFSPDGNRVAAGGGDPRGRAGDVHIWDVVTGTKVHTLQAHASIIWSVTFHPAGSRLASASDDGTVKIWAATTGRETLTLRGHFGGVTGVSFSPDGGRLASAGRDRSVRIWEAPADAAGP